MYGNVAYLFVLVVFLNPSPSTAGNIGCLFSDTLCQPDSEWCFDDHAFGRCLPNYGHYKENDLHLYDLGSEDLRVLEQEMQRLFMLGYRWSHTYTQCVLQALLHSITHRTKFELSTCNGDLDQDLEGALRAIEGEELEKVDPRDLAIVRFTPSVTDPHTNFADEIYFPPIREGIVPPSPAHTPAHEGSQGASDGGGEGNGSYGDEVFFQGDRESNSIAQDHSDDSNDGGGGGGGLPPPHHLQADGGSSPNPSGPPPQNTPQDHPTLHDQRFYNYYDDADYEDYQPYQYQQQYQAPLSPMVYHKRGMDGLRGSLPPRDAAISSDVSALLDEIRRMQEARQKVPSRNIFASEQRVFFPERLLKNQLEDDEDGDLGVFEEQPARPAYHPRLSFLEEDQNRLETPSWPSLPEDISLVEKVLRENEANNALRANLQPAFLDLRPAQRTPVMPFAEQRQGGRFAAEDFAMSPSALFPPPPRYESILGRLEEAEVPLYDRDLGRLGEDDRLARENSPRGGSSALREAFGPQLNAMLNDYNPGDDYEYADFTNANGDGLLSPDYDYSDLLNMDPAQLQSFVKKDEETMDYADPFAAGDWSFTRAEREDVKKPGPGFRSVNNFGFSDEDGAEWLGDDTSDVVDDVGGGEMVRGGGDDLILNPLDDLKVALDDQLPLQGNPDLILSGGGLVEQQQQQQEEEEAEEALQEQEARQEQQQQAEQQQVEAVIKESPMMAKLKAPSDAPASPAPSVAPSPDTAESFVYIIIADRFQSEKQGEDLAHHIVRLAGLSEDQLADLKVEEDSLRFRIKENAKGITASDVAKKTNALRMELQSHVGVEITKVGVGPKSSMSAVVFSSSERHILAAAAIVCGVMAALLVGATVLYFLRAHAKSRAKLQGLTRHDTEASKDYQDLCRARMAGKTGTETTTTTTTTTKPEPAPTHAEGKRISSLSRDSDNGNNSPSSRSSTSSCEEPVASNMDISTGHMVLSYMEDHLKNKDRLEQEWIALCAYEAEPCATTLALKPENSAKNRFPDAVPYDHNRVVLTAHANLNASDYINASSITDHDPRNPAYIATQGPLETTAADFWQLVWEQGSVVIVMLTRLTENGHAFCHRYWPEEGSDLYHIYEVHLVSEHIWCDDYLVRSFYLKNVRTGETRTVTQFHFLSWPDSGTPASTKALLEFRRKVNKSYRGRSCPIIVHCSDGIGRSGTYSLIDMVLNRMAKGAKEIDIAATLEHIRDQRPHMVRSKAQFEFVLMAVAEEVHAILKALPQ